MTNIALPLFRNILLSLTKSITRTPNAYTCSNFRYGSIVGATTGQTPRRLMNKNTIRKASGLNIPKINDFAFFTWLPQTLYHNHTDILQARVQ